MICVKDLLRLDCFSTFKLVSGESGLYRKVSWPNIAQTISIKEWLVGGDVILMSGIGLDITDELLTDIIKQAARGRAACIIMLIHPDHIKEIPESVINEAIQLGIAIFAAPWETKLSDLIRNISTMIFQDQNEERIRDEFIYGVLCGNIKSNNDNYKELYPKYGLMNDQVVVEVQLKNSHDPNQLNDAYLHDYILPRMNKEFFCFFEHVNYIKRYNREIFILSVSNKNEEKLIKNIKQVYEIISSIFSDLLMSFGIGEITSNPDELYLSYEQAKIAQKVIKDKGVFFYKNLGIYQLLFYIDDKKRIQEYVNKYLSSILDYDKKYHQELLNSLRVYLHNNQNLVKTAEQLYIHRNTMIKRIDKIETLLNCSLKNAETINQLYNAVKLIDLFIK